MNFRKIFYSYLKNGYYDFRDVVFRYDALKKNKYLKDKYKGSRLFILGSGSSIVHYDLVKLSDEYVMTQNNFHVHENISEIAPNFHCVVPYYQSESERSVWIDWVDDMQVAMPDAIFFWGKNTKLMIDNNFKSLLDRSYYINPSYNVLTLNRARIDLTKTVMSVPTVLTECLSVALYMGFSEIYLLGFDYNQMCGDRSTQNRFYGMSKITDTDAEREGLERQRGKNVLQSWYNIWLNYKQLSLLDRYAESKGIKIINASQEGILEIFERRPLKDVLGTDMRKG